MNKIKPKHHILILCLLLLGLLLGSSAATAWADVAANTRIINQATLSYDDGSGVQTVNASVSVTVDLVAGIPTLDTPPDDTTPYVGPATILPFTYTITANANGPDTYAISSTVVGEVNTATADASVAGSVDLGATITVSGSTTLVLQVPSDGASDNSVNGIEAGNTIVVGGEVVTVDSVSDPASGTATITLSTGTPLSGPPAAGVSVLEQQTFSVNVQAGTILTPGTDIVVTVDTQASSTAGSATDQVIATFTSGTATLTKYVRNLTFAAGNTGGTGSKSFTLNATTYDYYTGGVTGRPGDILQYVLVADNTGTGPVSTCTITDQLPTAYVTLSPDVYAATAEVIYVDENGTEHQLTMESDSDQAAYAASTLTANVGTGAGAATGGTLVGGKSVYVAYQVTINN